MNKQTITINGDNFSDLETFYEEVNRVLTKDLDWEIGHSLDALNDLLYGGFGVYEPRESIYLNWKNIAKSKMDLGYEETKRYYERKILQGHPWNVPLFKDKLYKLENGEGQTLFDVIIEIISDHENIEFSTQD